MKSILVKDLGFATLLNIYHEQCSLFSREETEMKLRTTIPHPIAIGTILTLTIQKEKATTQCECGV